MKILITGICGFAGSTIARELLKYRENLKVIGIDNFSRRGSETNRPALLKLGIDVREGDLRFASDLSGLPAADWVIDCAANPSVLAGLDDAGPKELFDHNLLGTVHLLEYCRKAKAGLILLSTSRVYSIKDLSAIPLIIENKAFRPDPTQKFPGLTEEGITEKFSTTPPLSLYGASKLTSEILALEYGETFDFPVWLDRCGVLAGAGQFGKADQGIFSFWIHSWAARRPLQYIGFEGSGFQVRDALHPRDLVPLLIRQMGAASQEFHHKVVNLSGGIPNSLSLAHLSEWCGNRFGIHTIGRETAQRPFDLPWLVLNSNLARDTWQWRPTTGLDSILEEIAVHAEAHPSWLNIT